MPPATCPHCREPLDIPPELRGAEVRCAACGTVFTVSAPPTVPTRARRVSIPASAPIPRGNRRVWALLFFVFAIVGSITAGCAGLMVWATNPQMHPTPEGEGRFKMEMPGAPSPVSTQAPDGTAVRGFESGRPISEDRYAVTYTDLPAGADLADPQAILNGAVKREAAAAGVETSRQVAEHDGYPALDVWSENGPMFLSQTTILRAVLVGRRVYVLTARGMNLRPEYWWVMRFFRSFEVAEGPAKAAQP